ncbi:methyltransferase domain-containing protein [Paracoccus sp. 12-3]|nr:methyltransferase domain-containing protein [Paracoccus xiamenensis]
MAFEMGCGTGHLTRRLCSNFEMRALTVNDLSPEAARAAKAAGATFLCGDALQMDWPEKPQLIASASMIQWLPDPARLLQRAARALAPGGWLAISGFGPEQYRELAHLGSHAGAPGLQSLADMAAALKDELDVFVTGERIREMHFPTPRCVLDHLRKTGVNGKAQGVWSKSRLAQFSADYSQRFGGPAGVTLTYHPVWIIGQKRN